MAGRLAGWPEGGRQAGGILRIQGAAALAHRHGKSTLSSAHRGFLRPASAITGKLKHTPHSVYDKKQLSPLTEESYLLQPEQVLSDAVCQYLTRYRTNYEP